MQISCSTLNVPVQYQSGKKEMLEICLAMQTAMQDLNTKTEVVLQACRAGGWLAYRPDWLGKLVRADTQEWAKQHLMTSGRIAATQLVDRLAWLDESGKPKMFDRTDYSEQQYCHNPGTEPDESDCELEDMQSVLTEQEKQDARVVQTHPKYLPDSDLMKQVQALSQHQKILAAQAKMAARTAGMTPDQKAKHQRASDRGTNRKRQKALRRNLAPQFRASLAGSSFQNRLASLTPTVVGKGQKKAGGKTAKNKKKAARKANKKKKASAAKKHHKLFKKLAARAKQAKWQRLNPEAASLLGNPDGPMKGKDVRLIAPGLSEFHRNSPARAISHFTCSNTVAVQNHGGTVSTYPASHLYILTGSEKLPMIEKAYLRILRQQVKRDALTAAGGQLKMEK